MSDAKPLNTFNQEKLVLAIRPFKNRYESKSSLNSGCFYFVLEIKENLEFI